MSDSEVHQITFLAAFPPIQTAIKIAGDNDGMRVQLDIPESEMASAVDLLAWRRKVLKVTIEVETSNERESPKSYF